MATEFYFTQEQLILRLSELRADIRYRQRKTLVELLVTSIVLVYVCGGMEIKIGSVLTAPLLLNVATWLYWLLDALRRVLRSRDSHPTSHAETDFVDEYRRLSYIVMRVSFQEAIFDTLVAIQFILIAFRFLVYATPQW